MPWIFKLSFCLFILSGCALFKDNSGPPLSFSPREKIYKASFDEVWRATQLALQNYPMRVNNVDLGILETDFIKSYNAWSPAHLPESKNGGLSYKLNVKVIKGKVSSQPVQKVSIGKEIYLKKDFFSDEKQQASDGLEEQALLYRIEREITIERGLQKAQKRQNQSDSFE